MDQLLIKPIRDPTPSVSMSGDSKEKSKTSFGNESTENSGNQSEKTLENEHSKSKLSIKDMAQSTEKFDQ